jgi:hypothetical protein
MEDQTAQAPAATDSGNGYASIKLDDGYEVEASGTTPEELTERHAPKAKDEDEPEPEPKTKDSEGEGDEPKDEDKTEEKPADAPRKGSARERMLQATRQAAEVKRQLAERDRELAELRARLNQPQDRQPQGKKELDPADFPTYDAYQKALFEQVADQRFEQRMLQQRIESEAHAEATKVVETAQGFASRAAEMFDDAGEIPAEYETVLSMRPTSTLMSGEQPSSSTDLAQLIMESDLSVPIIKHLAENPEEFRELIASDNPNLLTRRFGRLEARLEGNGNGSAPAKEKPAPRSAPQVSKAPPPVKPMKASRAGGSEKDPSTMDPDEYFEWRARQDRSS